MAGKSGFDWSDPLLLEEQLTDEERRQLRELGYAE